MSDFDAIVVGAGFGGLVASAYLAASGARTLVLEARGTPGGACETVELEPDVFAPLLSPTVYALDRRVLADLKLHAHGLKFAARAMALVGLRPGGRHIVLPHETYAARAAIRAFSAADAQAYLHYQRDMRGLARKLRPLWFAEKSSGDAVPARVRDRVDALSRMSAAACLDFWFETDALKAVLAADSGASGLSPHEPGSALHLLWRFAQESCGLQGAVAQIAGGPGVLTAAAASAAKEAGAELRCSARVRGVLVHEGRAAGIVLASGETIAARAVLSNLGRNETLALVPQAALGLDAAKPLARPRVSLAYLMLALAGPPPFPGLRPNDLKARFIIAERPESAAEAKGAGLTGALPAELVVELAVPTAADVGLTPPGRHVLTAHLPYLPAAPQGGWETQRGALQKRVLATLEAYAPGLADRVTTAVLLTQDDIVARYGSAYAGTAQPRLLASYETRLRTPLPGLYLCGGAAEPADAVAGRAGRLAAAAVLAERKGSSP